MTHLATPAFAVATSSHFLSHASKQRQALMGRALCPEFHPTRNKQASTFILCIAPSKNSESVSAKEEPKLEPAKLLEVSMPTLYDAWFPPSHQIATQMRAAVVAAVQDGIYKMELKWPCVPNLEEVKFGTKLNMDFGINVAKDLGMSSDADYPLVKRYLAEFSDLYWAKQVAQTFPDRTVWAVSLDGVSKSRAADSLGNLRLASMRRGSRPDVKHGDVVILIDPRMTESWIAGAKLQASPTSPLIFLNSQFNETYGLCGPRNGPLKGTEAVYFLRRVTRGYIFRAYPGKWQAVLECPDCSCEVLATYDKLPKLNEVARLVRETSNNRYGLMNDRYAKGFGGRL